MGFVEYHRCSKCHRNSLLEIEMSPGHFIGTCFHCDAPEAIQKKNVYINHCWNCGSSIDNRVSVKSLIPDMGYHCGNCGKDLLEWKKGLGVFSVGYWERIIPGPVAVNG